MPLTDQNCCCSFYSFFPFKFKVRDNNFVKFMITFPINKNQAAYETCISYGIRQVAVTTS